MYKFTFLTGEVDFREVQARTPPAVVLHIPTSQMDLAIATARSLGHEFHPGDVIWVDDEPKRGFFAWLRKVFS